MYTDFEDLNVYVYQSARGLILDGLIWCLGPYVDDTREYNRCRIGLAHVTCALARWWYCVGRS